MITPDKFIHLFGFSNLYQTHLLILYSMKTLLALIAGMFLSLGLSSQQLYLGPGLGLDHGGFGVKAEYMPIKSLGVHAGVGYYVISAGWSIGVSWKILPDLPRVTPVLGAMYGTNAGIKIENQDNLNKVSSGISFAGGVDIRVGKKNNKIEAGLIVPVRSKEFRDHYDYIKNRSDISIKQDLMPVLVYFGFAFAMFDR